MVNDKFEIGFDKLVELFEQTQTTTQTQAARSIDTALVVRNWLFGWYIVEFENGGAERAQLYGKKLLQRLSKEPKKSGLKGVSLTNLKQFRLFYETYKKIGQAVPDQSEIESMNMEKVKQALSTRFVEMPIKMRLALPAKSIQMIRQPEYLQAVT